MEYMLSITIQQPKHHMINMVTSINQITYIILQLRPHIATTPNVTLN